MDIATARALNALNNAFYAQHAASFSATRSAPWDGWRQLANLLRECGWRGAGDEARSVLDLACGNLRFEQFLTNEFPSECLSFHAVDSCPTLVPDDALHAQAIAYHECDILEAALNHADPLAGIPACSLSVCFGFMHHIPGAELRYAVLTSLIEHTAPHGLIAPSFWQFMDDERLARKAARADEIARREGLDANPCAHLDLTQLDEHDHFLGWQEDPRPLRYCHHFPDAEIDELVASVGTLVRERTRFAADGPSGTLNRYLILERR